MNGRGQRMRRTDQAVDVRTARSRPCAVMAAHLIGVAAGELDLLESVVRQVDAARRVGRPELFSLGQIARVVRVIGQCGRPSLAATLRSVHRWPHRGEQQRIGHLAPRLRLQMRLADECGAITGAAQHLGEGQRPERQRHAVVPDAVDRGHAAGEHRSAVRHADGVGDIAALEAPALRRQRVDVRRAHHAVAVAAEMIGAVLVGDDEQEIGAGHGQTINHLVASLDHPSRPRRSASCEEGPLFSELGCAARGCSRSPDRTGDTRRPGTCPPRIPAA